MKIFARVSLFALTLVGLVGYSVIAGANELYIAQHSAGLGNGQDCANTKDVAYFNTSAYWVSTNPVGTQIGPGTTVHLCGTFTFPSGSSGLIVNGSGASRNPITILFEAGAMLQSPNFRGSGGGAITILSKSNIIIDGGAPCGATRGGGFSPVACNGVIQNTDNGTLRGHQRESYGIEAAGCANCEFKNLGIYNIYVHTSPADTQTSQQQLTAIHANGGSNISIHDCLFHDVGWAITAPVITSFKVYNNYLYNIEHGVAYGAGNAPASSYANIFIHDNHFGSMVNWDYADGNAHHDSIHLWGDQGGSTIAGPVYIYNNQFDGDPGDYVNAYIFLEQAVSNATIFNNVLISPSTGHFPTELCQCNKGSSPSANNASFNNTVLGGSLNVGGSTNLEVSGTNLKWINNILQGQNTVLYFQGGTVATNGVLTNIYEDTLTDGGYRNTLTFLGGNNTPSLSVFQSQLPAGSGQDQGSQLLTNAAMKIDSQGHPLSASPAIQAGTNLTSFCNADPNLAPLCKDKAGNPRPQNTAWDLGAYNFGSSGGTQPAPPTNLTGVVH